MKKLVLIGLLLLTFNTFANGDDGAQNSEIGDGVSFVSQSLEYLGNFENLQDENASNPLYDAYMCVYTETFTSVMMAGVSQMMTDIFREASRSTFSARFVTRLIERSEPDFFDNILEQEESKPVLETCSSKIRKAKRQAYVSQEVLDKVISLGIISGNSLSQGILN